LRDLRRPGPEDEDDYYRRNDPRSFRPRPAMSIAMVLGLPLLVMLIAGA
jgi:hypothetical protein